MFGSLKHSSVLQAFLLSTQKIKLPLKLQWIFNNNSIGSASNFYLLSSYLPELTLSSYLTKSMNKYFFPVSCRTNDILTVSKADDLHYFF